MATPRAVSAAAIPERNVCCMPAPAPGPSTKAPRALRTIQIAETRRSGPTARVIERDGRDGSEFTRAVCGRTEVGKTSAFRLHLLGVRVVVLGVRFSALFGLLQLGLFAGLDLRSLLDRPLAFARATKSRSILLNSAAASGLPSPWFTGRFSI